MLAEEVLIIGASLDAANELARRVAEEKGAAFDWHRLTLPQLAAAIAAPVFAEWKLVIRTRLYQKSAFSGHKLQITVLIEHLTISVFHMRSIRT